MVRLGKLLSSFPILFSCCLLLALVTPTKITNHVHTYLGSFQRKIDRAASSLCTNIVLFLNKSHLFLLGFWAPSLGAVEWLVGLVGVCVHASPVPQRRQGKASAQQWSRERFFLNLQFLILLWPDVKVVPIWHGCKLTSQAIKISSFSL